MKLKPSSYFLIVIALLMLAILFLSAGFRYVQAKLLPMIVAGIILLLTLVELGREVRGAQVSRVTGEVKRSSVESGGLTRRYLLQGAWLVGFLLVIYVAGFLLAIPLFVVTYLRARGTKWRTAATLAIVLAISLYGIFTYLLEVRLHPGLIFEGLRF